MPTGIYTRKKRTKEHCENISKAKKGHIVSKETRKKIGKTHTGMKRSKEHCKNIAKAQIGKKLSPEHCKNISKANIGKKHSEEAKEKIRRTLKGTHRSKETIRKIRKALKGITKKINPNLTKSKETKRKMRESKLNQWQNPDYRERQLKAMFAARDSRPTKPERRLRNRLKHLFPGEYKYVGDGSIWIVGKNPDFINVNGQKKIIELFGDYWHGEERTGRTKQYEEQRRIRHFAKYGFRTLIVWQKELKNIPKLKRKLKSFNI